MGITAAIVSTASTVGSTAYGVYSANKAAKQANAAQRDALASRPDALTDQQQANRSALDAQAAQRRKANGSMGRQSTILTSPAGIPNAPAPATKTLLGQ